LPGYTGNLSANNISTAGSVSTANVTATGNVSAGGNVIANGVYANNLYFANGAPMVQTQGFVGDQQFYGINSQGPYSLNYTTSTDNVIVAINGLIQAPYSSFNVYGNTITFDGVVGTSEYVDVRFIGQGSSIGDQQFYGNGGYSYPLNQVTTGNAAIVTVNGLLQAPGNTYNITGNVITFTNTLDSHEFADIRYLATGRAGGYALLANTITFNNGTVQSTAYQVTTAPTSSIGHAGDRQGTVAYDSSYFYYCTANYDGTTAIWVRAAMATW
jgi:hypothetical protein